MAKEKFYDKNSTDLSQELIARPQLVRVSVVRVSDDLHNRFQCYVLLAKVTSFDLLSTCHLSAKRPSNCETGNFPVISRRNGKYP